MDINSEKTCPSCSKQIKQIAMVCIHCHVNLIQYKKDNPSNKKIIDNSTKTTPNLRNEDVIQRTAKESLINKKRFILFIYFLIFCFLGFIVIEEGVAFEFLILIITLPITIGGLIRIWKHNDNSVKNILKDCEVCGHPNHPDSNSCKNCGKELDNIGGFEYVWVIIGILLSLAVIGKLIKPLIS